MTHAPRSRTRPRPALRGLAVALVAAGLLAGCGKLGSPNAAADAPLPVRVCTSAAPSFGPDDATRCTTLEPRYRLPADTE